MASYTINEDDKTATLDIKVGGVFETAYSYDNGNVTLSERLETATLTQDNLNTNLHEIAKWIFDITMKLHPSNQPREIFDEKIKKEVDKVTADFSNKDIKVTDANFKFEDGVFKFKPRAEVTMNFHCFKSWYSFLKAFYEATI